MPCPFFRIELDQECGEPTTHSVNDVDYCRDHALYVMALGAARAARDDKQHVCDRAAMDGFGNVGCSVCRKAAQ